MGAFWALTIGCQQDPYANDPLLTKSYDFTNVPEVVGRAFQPYSKVCPPPPVPPHPQPPMPPHLSGTYLMVYTSRYQYPTIQQPALGDPDYDDKLAAYNAAITAYRTAELIGLYQSNKPTDPFFVPAIPRIPDDWTWLGDDGNGNLMYFSGEYGYMFAFDFTGGANMWNFWRANFYLVSAIGIEWRETGFYLGYQVWYDESIVSFI